MRAVRTPNVVFDQEEPIEERKDLSSRSPTPDKSTGHKGGGKATQANSTITDEKPLRNRSVVNNTAGHGDPTQEKSASLMAMMESPDNRQMSAKLLEQQVYPGLPDGQLIDSDKLPHKVTMYCDGCYYGPTRNKRPDGYGLFWYSSGDLYIGTWVDGMPSGHGYYYMAEGGFYFGAVDKGYANGHGVYFRKQDKLYYQGVFQAGFMDGKGYLCIQGQGHDCITRNSNIVFAKRRPVQSVRRVQLPSKITTFEEEMSFVSLLTNPETAILARHSQPDWESTYVGETNQDGHKHGVGSLLFANGSRYHGMFVDDHILGLGVAVDPQGNLRLGFFDQGGMHLFGYSATDADLYAGCYFHGSYDGPAFYYNNQIGRWILAYFSVGDILCKAYTGDGKLTLSHIALGQQLISLIIQKAFVNFENVKDYLGTTVLCGRSHSLHSISTDAALQTTMENTYFCKLIKQYIMGNELAKRKKFDGSAWENRSRSAAPKTKDMPQQVFNRYTPLDHHPSPAPTINSTQAQQPTFTRLDLPNIPNKNYQQAEPAGNFSFRETEDPNPSMRNNAPNTAPPTMSTDPNRLQLHQQQSQLQQQHQNQQLPQNQQQPQSSVSPPPVPGKLNLKGIPLSQAQFEGSSNSQRSSRRDLPSALKKPNFDFLTKV